MVAFVLCIVVEFLCSLNLMCVFISLLSSGNCVAAYCENAAHSAYDMFSKYKYLPNCQFIFPTSVFWSGISF